MDYHIYMALLWALLGAIQLYRAYTGNKKGLIVTLNRSQSPLLTKRQRWANASFGLCYVGFATAYLVLYFRHSHLG
ncbi:MAG TPA: hypothetical protein VGJ30_09015 [Candidatus Angelobacter sp.]